MSALKRTVTLVAAMVLVASAASAIPVLQLYIEGATYDSETEDWVLQSGGEARIWVIGDTTNTSGILDMHLAVAYSDVYDDVVITLTGTTIDGDGTYGGFTDHASNADGIYAGTFASTTRPMLEDGSLLPGHGVYGTGTENTWQLFDLGDMPATSVGNQDAIADFVDSFPTPTTQMGQINAYDFSFTGGDEDISFHFDLYNHYVADRRGRIDSLNAPFSHDATNNVVPLPPAAGLGLAGVGIVGLVGRKSKNQKSK